MENVATNMRERVYMINENDERIDITHLLHQWGAGEYKMQDIETIKDDCVLLYVPYLTFNTLEKVYIMKSFLEKNNKRVKVLIGYCSYSRQERETEHEPALLPALLVAMDNLLKRKDVLVLEPHNRKSFRDEGIYTISGLTFLEKTVAEQEEELNGTKRLLVVAPDHGAKDRNDVECIDTFMVLDKVRKDGTVTTTIGSCAYEIDENEKHTFVIYDDICDGGRTFANAAEIIKSKYPNSRVVLAVTHAILPFGISVLREKGIDTVYAADTCFREGEYYNGFLKVFRFDDILKPPTGISVITSLNITRGSGTNAQECVDHSEDELVITGVDYVSESIEEKAKELADHE